MVKKLSIILIIFLSILTFNVNAENFKTYSDNIIVYNIEENKIMYGKNINEKASIASLTKVMSALVIIEKEKDLTKEIDFQKVDFNFLKEEDLSSSSLDLDKTYTYKDFLYSFILESSADCGYALVLDTSNSVKEFVSLMNKKAKELGMKNTKFSNPIGLDDVNNYSTMEDMLILMKYSLKNETLKEIMSTFSYKTSNNDYIKHTLLGYMNKFDIEMPYLKGGKTGYNDDPGYALMSYAKKNNSSYIIVSTNASYDRDNPKHLKDAKKLCNDIVYFTRNNYQKEDVTTKYKGIKEVSIKNKKGDKLGTLKVYYKDVLVDTVDITLGQNVHFSPLKFLKDNKYIVISSISYLVIILATIIIVVRIKKRNRSYYG